MWWRIKDYFNGFRARVWLIFMNYCFLISKSEFLLLGRALSFLTGGPVSAGRKSESYCDIMALWDLVVKSKLYPRSGSVSLRQLNPIHRKRATKFFYFLLENREGSNFAEKIWENIPEKCWKHTWEYTNCICMLVDQNQFCFTIDNCRQNNCIII